MKIIDIINRRCKCILSEISVLSQSGKRVVYKSAQKCGTGYEADFNINNTMIKVTYTAENKLDDNELGLMEDLLDVYIENIASWEVAESLSKSHEEKAGRATLDEIVRVAVNSLVYSNLFDKAAVMFFNEQLYELRGVYLAGIPAYNEKQTLEFVNKRVPVTKDVLLKLIENNKSSGFDASMEFEDRIFKSIDNVKLSNRSIIAPMLTANKIYGVLIVYSDKAYTDNHIYTARSTARLLNTMMMSVISNQKYEYTASFYKEIEDDMRSKQSLVTLGNYVATIAHEVKNPLISIGGFAKRLMKQVTNDDLKKMAGIIANESIRLEHLTEDILSFSKKHTPNKEKIYLKKLLLDIMAVLDKRTKDECFKIDLDMTDDDYIYADDGQIKQVFINLIVNAMNAMGCNGEILIKYVKEPDRSKIIISDTGPGIPPDIMADLFKPFFTTSSSGTGLGLPISRKILNNHGGDLTVANKSTGHGAVFTITLPDNKE